MAASDHAAKILDGSHVSDPIRRTNFPQSAVGYALILLGEHLVRPSRAYIVRSLSHGPLLTGPIRIVFGVLAVHLLPPLSIPARPKF